MYIHFYNQSNATLFLFFFSLALFFFDGFDVRRLRLRLRTFASILTHWKLFRIHQYRQWWRLYQKLCTFFFHLLFLFVISRSIWSQLKEREMSVLINIAWKSARKKDQKFSEKKWNMCCSVSLGSSIWHRLSFNLSSQDDVSRSFSLAVSTSAHVQIYAKAKLYINYPCVP